MKNKKYQYLVNHWQENIETEIREETRCLRLYLLSVVYLCERG